MNLASRFAILCPMALVSACTVIRAEGVEHITMTRLGVLRLEAEPDAEMIAIESTGIGVVPSIYGASVGFRTERIAILPNGPSCKVVLFRWPDDPETARQLRALLADKEICAMERGE